MQKTLFLLVLALFGFSLPPASANEKLRGIKGKDDRQLIENYKYPWSAIGRINKESGGFCTGTLIGPNVVLTAAHCFYNKKRKTWLKARTIHFLAGYRRGSYIAHSRGTKYVLAPGYDANKRTRISSTSKDWAILFLEHNLQADIGSFGISQRPPTDLVGNKKLIQAGYSQDKAHILSINSSCPFNSYNNKHAILFHSCDAVPGDSGSPIFYKTRDGYHIAAIHVATTKSGTSKGIAVAADKIIPHLKALNLLSGAAQAHFPTQPSS